MHGQVSQRQSLGRRRHDDTAEMMFHSKHGADCDKEKPRDLNESAERSADNEQ